MDRKKFTDSNFNQFHCLMECLQNSMDQLVSCVEFIKKEREICLPLVLFWHDFCTIKQHYFMLKFANCTLFSACKLKAMFHT